MNTPRSLRRSSAYHIVVASFVPWILSQGRGGRSMPSAMPASMS